MLAVNFTYKLNVSLQIGDSVYFTNLKPDSGFTVDDGLTKHFGTVEDIISSTEILVRCPYVDSSSVLHPNSTPSGSAHISFSKNRFVNNSDLLGYYGSVVFKNDSRNKAELFSVGSEISESSK